jgi:hypothetical protein
MSYAEYLRRKASAAPIIIDARPKMDASTFTRHKRVTAAVGSYRPTEGVIGNINDMNPAILRANGVTQRTQVSTSKAYGGSVPDASTYTDYAAGKAAAADYKTGPPGTTKLVLNATVAPAGMTTLSGCAVITTPSPQTSGTISATQIQKGAGDWVRLNKDCVNSGRIGEPHEPGVRGTPQFVDDTISLNTGTFRIGTGSATANTINGTTVHIGTGSTPTSSSAGCPPANHTHPAIVPYAAWAPRPTKGAGGIPVFVQPRPGDARKVGGLVPSDHLKYVEKHHGNDGTVNPRRVPAQYQIPAGAPAHLKINDPKKLV